MIYLFTLNMMSLCKSYHNDLNPKMDNNALNIEKTALWHATYEAQKHYRFVAHQGGSSSGKTFAILDVLLFLMCTEKGLSITVTTNNYPHLRRGPLKDLKSIWSNDPLYQKMISVPNQNGCKCDVTGSVLEFACFPTIETAKGPKRDILYIDEATSIPYEIAFELIARTKKTIYFSWNPSARFWMNDKYEGHPQAKWIYSTHRANQFLPQSIHDELEALKDKDPYRYRVYCLGMTGQVDGLVYTNWQQINELPPLEECKWRTFGLDYGFQNDPTTLVEVRYAHGELFLKEHIYKTGMTNMDITDTIKTFGFQNELIVADSAEMKSIEEMRRLGIINIKPAIKGPGSIMQGISLVQSMKLNVTMDSTNLKTELMNYMWDTDALGHSINKPIDKWNHCMDALRYAVSYKMERPKTKSKLSHF